MNGRLVSVVTAGGVLLLMLGTACSALAGEPEADGGWPSWEQATGNWGGARTSLEEKGLTLELGFTAIWQANHRGGAKSHPQGKCAASWDAAATLDTGAMGLWPGGTLFVSFEGSSGKGIDGPYVGSFFGANCDAGSTGDRWSQFSEYWYQQDVGEGLVSFKVGKIDATGDFDANAFANDECCQFLNGALVNNPVIPFPDYALGGSVFVRPGGGFYVGAGAYDANAEGWTSGRRTALEGDSDWFVIAEAGIEVGIPTGGETTLPGTYRVGAWHDPLRYEDLRTGEERKGQSGAYVSVDQMVYKESANPDDTQGLGLFARYGYAPDHYSEVEHFCSCGLCYQGLVAGRDDDVLGIGFARGRVGSPTRDAVRHAAESVVECFYNIAVGGGAALTLDVQYIHHPGADAASAFVPGLRLQVDF